MHRKIISSRCDCFYYFSRSVKRRIKRPSLVKINSMTDLLSLKVPSVEAIQTMEREDMTEKFLVLLDHFYASVDEIRKLRVKLRESQDNNDALEIDKVRPLKTVFSCNFRAKMSFLPKSIELKLSC